MSYQLEEILEEKSCLDQLNVHLECDLDDADNMDGVHGYGLEVGNEIELLSLESNGSKSSGVSKGCVESLQINDEWCTKPDSITGENGLLNKGFVKIQSTTSRLQCQAHCDETKDRVLSVDLEKVNKYADSDQQCALSCSQSNPESFPGNDAYCHELKTIVTNSVPRQWENLREFDGRSTYELQMAAKVLSDDDCALAGSREKCTENKFRHTCEKLFQTTTMPEEMEYLNEYEKTLVDLELSSNKLLETLSISINNAEPGITPLENLIKKLHGALLFQQDTIKSFEGLMKEKDRCERESSRQLTDLKNQLQSAEESYRNFLTKTERDKSALEELAVTRMRDVQKKYVAKLRNVQAQSDANIANLKEELDKVNILKASLELRIGELEQELGKQQEDVKVSKAEVLHPGLLQEANSEVVSEADDKCHRIRELERMLEESEARHELILQSHVAEFEKKNRDNLADLKRKAEVRLSQIKKQLLAEKDMSILEFERMNDELRAQLSACEDELHNLSELNRELQVKAHEAEELAEQVSKLQNMLSQKGDSEVNVVKQLSEMQRHVEEKHSCIESKEKIIAEQTAKLEQLESSVKELSKGIRELKAALSDEEHNSAELQRQLESYKVDLRTAELNSEKDIDQLKAEFAQKLRDTENDHNSRVKQLVKEFRLQMGEKEKEFQTNFSEVLEKCQREEDKMLYEHQKELQELRKELHEKDVLIDDITENSEVQIKATEMQCQAEVKSHLQKILELETTIGQLQLELQTERDAHASDAVQVTSKHTANSNASATDEIPEVEPERVSATTTATVDSDLRRDVISLTKLIQEMQLKHSQQVAELEGQLDAAMRSRRAGRSPVAGSSRAELDVSTTAHLQSLELQNKNLQAQVLQQTEDKTRLKIRERELQEEIRLLRSQQYVEFDPTAADVSLPKTALSSSAPKMPTQMEYLKNIIFQYMMGTETVTLAKVICTVLKFSEEQTQSIMERHL